MLVLSRKVNERIVIEEGRIVLTVARIDKDKVRIGIEADRSISVVRQELLWKKPQAISPRCGNLTAES